MAEAVAKGSTDRTSDRRFLSLGQWLFLALAVFLVVPLCISNLWGYFQSRRYLTEAAFRNVSNVAELEASHVALDVQNAEELFAADLSADRHLADLARMLSAGDESARGQARAELAAVQAKMSGPTSVEQIQIISPTGAVLVSTLADKDSGSGAVPPACMHTSADGPVIAGVAGQGQKPSLLLAGALTGDRNESLGIVCARVRLDVHRYLVQAHRARTSRATLYLLDERGGIVDESFNSDGRRARYGEQFRSRGRTLRDLDHAWEGRYLLDSGVEELAAYAPIPSLGWGVAVEVPVAHALRDLRRLERRAALITFVVALFVITAAIWSWRTVVSPLQSLSSTAERMASGATGETVKPGGSREIAELARTFNRMSLALWESQHTLERRIAERTRELGESREFAELLLNSIDHRVIVVNRSYRIIKANAAAVRLYGLGLVGTPCYQAFEGRTEPCEQCAASRTFATGQAASEERSQQTGRGREPVRIETYPVFGADERVESVIEIGRIVTAEKQIQMQMMHQEKMAAFGLLAAGVAHDIGNPLAAIESQLQLARQQPNRQEETLGVVSKEVARISRMLRELVDFTRRRRDALMLVSANQVVEDVTRLLSHDPRARTVTIARRLAAKLPGIRTKEDHLFQVLLNLGLNGLDAMAEGGTLEFETCTRSGWVIVRVRDTGTGIAPELQGRLFEPFFTTKAPERGTGLGLFVSKGIVERMGGELTVEHTDSRGTVFAIFLPVEAHADGGVVT
jgi:C4-dicarboxylate-specific signal transduction histidine kinase